VTSFGQFLKSTAAAVAIGAGFAGAAQASDVLVSSDITVSTTWTANNTYNLQSRSTCARARR
jgi:hypothetical protein